MDPGLSGKTQRSLWDASDRLLSRPHRNTCAAPKYGKSLLRPRFLTTNRPTRRRTCSARVGAASSHVPVLIVLGANWCEDCRALDRAIHKGHTATLMAKSFTAIRSARAFLPELWFQGTTQFCIRPRLVNRRMPVACVRPEFTSFSNASVRAWLRPSRRPAGLVHASRLAGHAARPNPAAVRNPLSPHSAGQHRRTRTSWSVRAGATANVTMSNR